MEVFILYKNLTFIDVFRTFELAKENAMNLFKKYYGDSTFVEEKINEICIWMLYNKFDDFNIMKGIVSEYVNEIYILEDHYHYIGYVNIYDSLELAKLRIEHLLQRFDVEFRKKIIYSKIKNLHGWKYKDTLIYSLNKCEIVDEVLVKNANNDN